VEHASQAPVCWFGMFRRPHCLRSEASQPHFLAFPELVPLPYVGYFYKEMALLIPAVRQADISGRIPTAGGQFGFPDLHANPCVWLREFSRRSSPSGSNCSIRYFFQRHPGAFLLWRKGRFVEFQYYAFLIAVGSWVSYVGYIFVPARGPRYLLNSLQHVPWQGLWLFRSMQDGLDKLESYH